MGPLTLLAGKRDQDLVFVIVLAISSHAGTGVAVAHNGVFLHGLSSCSLLGHVLLFAAYLCNVLEDFDQLVDADTWVRVVIIVPLLNFSA